MEQDPLGVLRSQITQTSDMFGKNYEYTRGRVVHGIHKTLKGSRNTREFMVWEDNRIL